MAWGDPIDGWTYDSASDSYVNAAGTNRMRRGANAASNPATPAPQQADPGSPTLPNGQPNPGYIGPGYTRQSTRNADGSTTVGAQLTDPIANAQWKNDPRNQPAPTPASASAPTAPGASTSGALQAQPYTPAAVDYSRYDAAAGSYDTAQKAFQGELDRLAGTDPFGNQAFLRQATDRAAAQAQGIASGGLSTATARAGNMNQARAQQDTLYAQGRDQMAVQRAQDQVTASGQRLQAAGGLANVAQARAGNEVQLAQTQTQALSQNMDAALKAYGINAQLTQQDVESLRQAAIAYSQIDQARYATDAQYAAQMDEQITQKYMADQQLKGTMAQIKANSTMTQKDWLMGSIGLASGLGSAAVMGPAKSDVRSKYAFQDPDIRDLQDYLGRTKGKLYRYKNPSAPGQRPGLNYGPMAQSLAATKIGRTVVVEGKDGLYVDTARLALADHAALAHLAAEIKALKEAK